ncbi:MAG: hypothetical protein V1909_04410 [Candidatus Micrarchaeota archaeon]
MPSEETEEPKRSAEALPIEDAKPSLLSLVLKKDNFTIIYLDFLFIYCAYYLFLAADQITAVIFLPILFSLLISAIITILLEVFELEVTKEEKRKKGFFSGIKLSIFMVLLAVWLYLAVNSKEKEIFSYWFSYVLIGTSFLQVFLPTFPFELVTSDWRHLIRRWMDTSEKSSLRLSAITFILLLLGSFYFFLNDNLLAYLSRFLLIIPLTLVVFEIASNVLGSRKAKDQTQETSKEVLSLDLLNWKQIAANPPLFAFTLVVVFGTLFKELLGPLSYVFGKHNLSGIKDRLEAITQEHSPRTWPTLGSLFASIVLSAIVSYLMASIFSGVSNVQYWLLLFAATYALLAFEYYQKNEE